MTVLMQLADLLFLIELNRGRYLDPLSLASHQSQIYSQNGEDGVIAEIFRRIAVQDRFFVEIGIGDGRQNNTRFLLEQGWRGVWIDADCSQARDIFGDFVAQRALTLIESQISAETVNAVLDAHQVPATFDFLSLDIDQNTSHVWRSFNRQPRVACIEYNASLPLASEIEVPYQPATLWEGTNWFGASLKTLERIAASKGLSLVGCELAGVNAFFVNDGEAKGRFQEPFTAETHWEPPRYSLGQRLGHPASSWPRSWIIGS